MTSENVFIEKTFQIFENLISDNVTCQIWMLPAPDTLLKINIQFPQTSSYALSVDTYIIMVLFFKYKLFFRTTDNPKLSKKIPLIQNRLEALVIILFS